MELLHFALCGNAVVMQLLAICGLHVLVLRTPVIVVKTTVYIEEF